MEKNNQGAFFVNDRRDKESHAHYKGSAVINGVEYWVSIWGNTSEKGTKYWSMKYEPKEKKEQAAPKPAPAKDPFRDDEEMPF